MCSLLISFLQANDPKTKSKAGILQKCLDYIKQLEKVNTALQNENRMLQHKLKGGNNSSNNNVNIKREESLVLTPGAGQALMCVLVLGTLTFGSLLPRANISYTGGKQLKFFISLFVDSH